MKTTEQFLSDLDNLDIKLWLDGDRLRCNAPKEALTSELKAQLQTRKEEILHLMRKINSLSHLNQETITPVSRTENIPLSFAQQRLYFLAQLEPESPFYNEFTALKLSGQLNISILKQSLEAIISRHEPLRTNFCTNSAGKTVQIIHSTPEISLSIINLEQLNLTSQQPEIEKLASQEAKKVFNLEQDLLLRVTLLKLDPSTHIILFTTHHIVTDGWSTAILVKEIATLYQAFLAGEPSPLPELTIQYADFAVWQRKWLTGEVLSRQLNYWQQHLQDIPRLNLPTDYSRPVNTAYQGASHTFELSPSLTADIKALAQQEGVTLFMILLAAFQVLLSRYSNQKDLAIGTPIANRNRGEIESLIGFFVNTLVIRSNLEGNPSFRELLQRVKEVTLAAYTHQDLPFEQLVEELQVARHLNLNPLFDVMFSLETNEGEQLQLPGLTLSYLEAENETAIFDLILSIGETATGLRGTIKYSTELFKQSTIERMGGHFQTLLEAITANPREGLSQLPILTKTEQQQLLVDWNNTQVKYPQDQCIHQLFAAQAAKTPGAIAVVFEDCTLTYRQLNNQANQLANYLRQQSNFGEIDRDAPLQIAICLDRSLEMIIGLLAILKAGYAYIPLDPSYPSDRLAYMLADSQAAILLTQQEILANLPSHQGQVICLDQERNKIAKFSTDNPICNLNPDNLAYIIYTSGSTGKPKGAMNTHRGICNRLMWMQDTYQLTARDCVLQKTPFSFDVSVWEFFWSLLVGARIAIARPDGHRDPNYLVDLIEQQQVTTLHFVPSMLPAFLDVADNNNCQSLKRVICSGETLSIELQKRFFSTLPIELHNLYGPTETAIDVTAWQCDSNTDSQIVPIGYPIANTQIYLLDNNLNPVPLGIPGEIYIGGIGVGKGYLNNPQLTAEKFIANPFEKEQRSCNPAKLYKTGDLARYRPDGSLEFLGRIDHQVKIRGFRLELGEIETVLSHHPSVREVVAISHQDELGNHKLIAYIVTKSQATATIKELREFCSQQLPEYMIPAAFITLDCLPLTPNGKCDRQALPRPELSRPELAESYQEPQSKRERQLAEIWQEVLNLEKVGVNDNFFALGGDSILTFQIIAKAHQAEIYLTPKQLFQHQTIAQLATVASSKDISTPAQGLITGTFPLIPIQRRFFESNFANPHHYNQAVMLNVPADVDVICLEEAIATLISHHDLLRTQFKQTQFQWQPDITAEGNLEYFTELDFAHLSPGAVKSSIEETTEDIQASLNLFTGQIFKAVLFNLGSNSDNRLLIVIHHLVVDGVSWRILLEDLQNSYYSLKKSQIPQLPPKTSSYTQWAERLANYALSKELHSELDYWVTNLQQPITPPPLDYPEGENSEASTDIISVSLNPEETIALLQEIPAAYQTQINDVLLTALAQTFGGQILFDLEGHGREALFEDLDISRTVGWLTSIFPVLLNLGSIEHQGEALKAIKEQLRAIPHRGIGYGILRYLNRESTMIESLNALPQAQIIFNYLGQFEGISTQSTAFTFASEFSGKERSLINHRTHILEIDSLIINGCLQLNWIYSQNLHRRSTIESLAETYWEKLRSLILHCQSPDAGGFTPSDFAEFKQSNWNQDDLEAITTAIKGGR